VTLAAQESDALLKLARFQRAAEVVSRGLAAARQAGLQSWDQADFLAANAAEALLALGRTGQAAALIDPLTTGLPDRDHRWAHTARAEIDLLRGDTGAAADRWQLLHSLPAPGWVDFAWETARRAAEAALWTGRPGDALDKVQRVLPLVKTPDLTILCGRLLTAGMWACADLAGQARARRDQPGAAAAAAAAAALATWVQQVCGAPFADHPYLAAIPAELATWDAERTRLAGPGTGQPRRRARSRGHVRRRLRRRCDDPLADARGDPGDAGRALPGDPGPCAESGALWKIGGCDGGAAWLPPGLAGRFAEVEQSTRAAVSSLTGDGGARYAAFWDWLDAHLPGEPCWFLDLVGVAPGAQGRGLGRVLVGHRLARARADGYAAFLRYPHTWLTGGGEAAAVWIPPGGTEMTPEQEQRLAGLAAGHLGPAADACLELVRRFEAAHPWAEPHYYLTLLGTHPDHRGQGIGMRLLAHNLDLVDAAHLPAYLESTNPANNRRYASVGFEPHGEFCYPGGGPVVTTMWRPAR